MKAVTNKKIGIVLSGGGVRSLAHIGLLQVLNEEGIYPNIISGTSGGALVGGLYASGIAPIDMLDFFYKMPLFKFSLVSLGKPCIVDSAKYEKLFERFFKKRFDDLNCSLSVTATNLLNGNVTYFNKGKLIKAVIASSALPPYFSPIEINKELYSDGGILDNFPITPIRNKCDAIIGSFVNPLVEIRKENIKKTTDLLSRVFNIGMNSSYYEDFKSCNYVFLPKGIKNIGVLESKKINEAYMIGYLQAKREIQKIKESIL